MSDYYYNFKMGEENRGYYYLYHDEETMFSYTRFLIAEDEIFINIFRLKLAGEKILACQYRTDDWVDFTNRPANHYPTSGYPLFLSKALKEPFVYTAVYEGDGSIFGETTLTPVDNVIQETRDGKLMRQFTMENGIPVAIDWGGPISYLCADATEAVRDSGLAFTTEAGA